jgi:hypothetical protein
MFACSDLHVATKQRGMVPTQHTQPTPGRSLRAVTDAGKPRPEGPLPPNLTTRELDTTEPADTTCNTLRRTMQVMVERCPWPACTVAQAQRSRGAADDTVWGGAMPLGTGPPCPCHLSVCVGSSPGAAYRAVGLPPASPSLRGRLVGPWRTSGSS